MINQVLLNFLNVCRTHEIAEENYYKIAEIQPIQGSCDEVEELKKNPMIGTDEANMYKIHRFHN